MLVFFLLLFSNLSFANFADTFGAGAQSMMLGNQADHDSSNLSHNYYAPAVLGQEKKIRVEFSFSTTNYDFKEISSIRTSNLATKDSETTGDVSTDYDALSVSVLHLNLPLHFLYDSQFSFSFYFPMSFFLDSNSGDPFLPEYVMYRSRPKRFGLYAHLISAPLLGKKLNFSLGLHSGLQVSSLITARQSINGSSEGSSGSLQVKVKPSLAVVSSVAYKATEKLNLLMAYHQEMKSNLKADFIGEINNPALPYDLTVDSLSYYDPHIFRLGLAWQLSQVKTYYSLEYQAWSGYRPPTISIARNGGSIQSSDQFETLKTKDILVPHLGLSYPLSSAWTLAGGLSYRPSPLDSDFSGNGNSLDTDKMTYASGLTYFRARDSFSWKVAWGIQLQKLKEKSIRKTINQEDGQSGEKIGSPGYTLGGSIWSSAVSLGIEY